MVAKIWSKFWKASSNKSKQRKYRFNAPLNVKRKMINASLSPELKKTYGIRSFPVRKEDFVEIKAGQFKGKSGKVTKVVLSRMKIYIDNIGVKRSDGSTAMYPIDPSNIMITKLDLKDKSREDKLKSFKGGSKDDKQ